MGDYCESCDAETSEPWHSLCMPCWRIEQGDDDDADDASDTAIDDTPPAPEAIDAEDPDRNVWMDGYATGWRLAMGIRRERSAAA